MLKKVLVILVLSIMSIYYLCLVFVSTDGDKNFTFIAILQILGAYAIIIPALFSNNKGLEDNTKVKQTSDENTI